MSKIKLTGWLSDVKKTTHGKYTTYEMKFIYDDAAPARDLLAGRLTGARVLPFDDIGFTVRCRDSAMFTAIERAQSLKIDILAVPRKYSFVSTWEKNSGAMVTGYILSLKEIL